MTAWLRVLHAQHDAECRRLTAAIDAKDAAAEYAAVLRCEQTRKAIADAVGVPYRPALGWVGT